MDKQVIYLEGNIDLDNMHRKIVEIMEGGQDAFERRQLIYIHSLEVIPIKQEEKTSKWKTVQ